MPDPIPVDSQSRGTMTPEQALMVLRFLWVALLGGMLAFAGVTIFFAMQNASPNTALAPTFFYVALGALVVAVPAGLFARLQTYKKHWRGDTITPAGYFSGNLVLFGVLEGVAALALAGVLACGIHAGLLAVAGGALAVYLFNFPNGEPMRPHGPRLPEPEKL